MKDKNATVIVDLSPSEEEIFLKLQKDARWGVKKAKKEGLEVREEFTEKNFDEFYDIYKSTCEYGGINPQTREELKERTSKLFLCFKDGKVIAGAGIIIEDEKKYRLFINGSHVDFLKYQPNNILYWELIVWGKRKGYKTFDLGGYQLGTKPEDKLYHVNKFKERWGEIVVTEKDYSVVDALGRKAVRNSKVAKAIWNKIKGRPKRKRKNEQ